MAEIDGVRMVKPFIKWGVKEIRLAVLGSFAAMVFGVVIMGMSLVAVVNPVSVYQQALEMPATAAAVPVKYYLPYPGILPDSPLYRLKSVRDAVVLFFTQGEEKKAEKELLYADKRIKAAQELVDGGKLGLGVSTATKAEKYLEKAVLRVEGQMQKGVDMKSMLITLVDATAKHSEILTDLQTKTDGSEQKVIMTTLSSTKTLHDRTEQLLREAK